MNERDIFLEALEKPTAAVRLAYLDAVCGDNRALRTRLEALLQSHVSAGEFLGKSAVERVAEKMASIEEGGETEGVAASPPLDEPLEFLAPSQMAGSLGRIGHYEVQEVIGRGGMGIVLRALDERLHRIVAIKVMAPQLATSTASRKRFSKEAQAAAAICHDHIVTIHAVDEANGLPYLVMQYVAGASLQERITRSGALQLHEILRIGMQAASGLAAAHDQGLIHRDVKPANILLENGIERVKLTDFGLARAAADSSTSQSGVIAGTPQYMSPEQARGEALDRRSDLFSLGSVLYAMCTGRSPFRGANSIAVLKRVCEETPAAIRGLSPEIPGWLAAIVEKLHAKDPAKRYQTAAEVVEVLRYRLAEVQHPSVASLPVRKKSNQASHAKHWGAAAAILLLLLTGLGMAEGTGMTELTSTVIRLLTREGTLAVEVSDPDIKVTVDGDDGLVITGAGLHEVRLKPGRHRIQADKNGEKVPLENELVSIAQGNRTMVRVKLETPPVSAAVMRDMNAFVLLAAGNEKRFNTLAEAVVNASDGDTIEIRGNGPFVTEPIDLGSLRLTIRAGAMLRPVIKLSPAQSRSLFLLKTDAALILEGLEFQRMDQDRPNAELQLTPYELYSRSLLNTSTAPLHIANCRFLAKQIHACINSRAPMCELRNCEFLGTEPAPAIDTEGIPAALVWAPTQSGSRLLVSNCLQIGGEIVVGFTAPDATEPCSVELINNTSVWKYGNVRLSFDQQWQRVPKVDTDHELMRLHSSGNVFAGENLVLSWLTDSPNEAESVLKECTRWQGEQNLFSLRGILMGPSVWQGATEIETTTIKSLPEWKEYWGSGETGSLEGEARFEGGNLLHRALTAPDRLHPEDFRLRPDSAGYRARKDGKDVGADVDLVGPGPAYERWKRTREYAEWLAESGQEK